MQTMGDTVKPILYIDVDGVLFGFYGDPECFQLRPGVLSFLTWAGRHFNCKWLTAWPEDALRRLFGSAYGEQVQPFPEYVDWHAMSREKGVTDRKTAAFEWSRDWYWIEDGPVGVERRDLQRHNAVDRLVMVKQNGADELERIRKVLEDRLSTLAEQKTAPIEAPVREGD